jgi:hypothetical protein
VSARLIQTLLGLIFLVLGGWVLLLPGQVEALVLNPEYAIGSQTSRVLFGCFGAQAVLCGTVIVASDFKARTFLIFGLLGSIPFFVFNYYFVFVVPIFSRWMLLDFVGNIGILVLGLAGWRLAAREEGLRSGT